MDAHNTTSSQQSQDWCHENVSCVINTTIQALTPADLSMTHDIL